VERRIRILMVLAGVNGLFALGAIGLIVWMNEDPVYWFPALASAQGPKGEAGDRGAQGPQGQAGPAGVSGDVALESRISDLESTVGSSATGQDYGTELDDQDSRISDIESTVGSSSTGEDYGTRLDAVEADVSELQDRMDTAEASLSGVCDALDFANDPNLNGVC
jgi:hypothetical protein